MRQVKFYNVIFPIWFLMFFPPVIFITLAGNFIIDSLVILACFFLFKLSEVDNDLKTFYKESVLKVWLFGFLADIIGAVILFAATIFADLLRIDYKWVSGINYDPFSSPVAFCVVVFAMMVSGIFIFLLNYKVTFNQKIEEKRLRFKVALTIAIITMPWTFLLPTKWLYHGI